MESIYFLVKIDTLSESFTYDDLDRLLQISGPADTLDVSYDASKKERIYSKSDAGEEYKYSASNNFQLTSIDSATSALTSRPDMSISYTSFNKVDTISEGDYLITFDYGPNAERVKMEVKYRDTLQYTRYYFGSYELTDYDNPDDYDEEKTWFSSGSGIFGFNRVIDTADHNFYILKDHLGSVMTVANENRAAVEFFSYDAWGRRRNDSTWAYDSTLTAEYTSRGYTGHEHMDETCLINMNGRVYDPLVGLFLSPDPVLQEPMNPLNYNRYNYVLNNPLKYTDPSGYMKAPRDYEDEQMYAEMMTIINDWNYRSYGAGGGGAGGSSYGNYINSVHQNPDEWTYDYSTMTYRNRRTGGRISPNSQAGKNIVHSIGLNRYLVQRSVNQVLAAILVHDNLPLIIKKRQQAIEAQRNGSGLLACLGDPPVTSSGERTTYMAGALVISGVLLADDVTGVLVMDDILIPFILGGALILDMVLNPGLEGTTTSRGNPADWSFDPRIQGLENDKYFQPGSKPPKGFIPAIIGIGAYELYVNWPRPENYEQPIDNIYIEPVPVYPYEFRQGN